jgi:hypothetical protein
MSSVTNSQSVGYTPSGKCDWLKLFTIALPFSLLAAFALAVGLMLAFVGGFYFFIVVPAVAGLLLGAVAAGAFRFAHCRNPYAAAVLGFLLGTIMFLGYFEADFVHRFGWRALTRMDALPNFIIKVRMNHDVIKDMHDVGNRNPKPAPVMNWVLFAADWMIAACLCAGVTFAAARRAYCENCQSWMVRKKAATAPGNASCVVSAIAAKQIASLPDWPDAKVKSGATASQFEVEYCPGKVEQSDVCPIYLTAKEVVQGQKKSVVVARQIQLSVEDLAELSKKLSFK